MKDGRDVSAEYDRQTDYELERYMRERFTAGDECPADYEGEDISELPTETFGIGQWNNPPSCDDLPAIDEEVPF